VCQRAHVDLIVRKDSNMSRSFTVDAHSVPGDHRIEEIQNPVSIMVLIHMERWAVLTVITRKFRKNLVWKFFC